jgi:cytochrome c peroxidase
VEAGEQHREELQPVVVRVPHIVVFLLVGVAVWGCRKDPRSPQEDEDMPFALQLPAGFPMPATPDDNPLTLASVQLGKALFFDARLSRDGTISCASCHHPERAFSDEVALSVGVDGRMGERNSPTLANVGYHTLFFRDGGVTRLEEQVIHPVHDAAEMDHSIHAAAERLRGEEPYRTLSMRAYGRPLDGRVLTWAIANYERTLVSGWSRWDRWMQGDAAAMSAAEVRGWELFNSEALNCNACHSGFDLSDHEFHNVGLYLDYNDPGRGRVTLQQVDEGRFKTPTLRNIALTAPYMHDGSMGTLEEVVDHFASGGKPHANKSPELRTFGLAPEQKADLIAFLHALTDERPIDQVP